MPELNDSSSIKLFGKMIPLLTLNRDETLVDDCFDRNLLSSSNSLGALNSNLGVQAPPPMEDQEKHEDDDSGMIPLSERKPSWLESSKNEEKTETNGSQEKTLKKPDKILQCPRCNSKETKFCYYNNYNVNQPRHFCKNCQRYWTAGGAMRNMPVGAGRRKTKSSSSALHYHHVMISKATFGAQGSDVNGVHGNHSCENNNSCVLTFGSDSSVFNLSHLPPPRPPPAFYRPGFPASFYSSPTYALSPASPALGKHSREEKGKPSSKKGDSNSKALRIDDPYETAKSSMLTTLMIKTKNTNSINSGGIFNGFQSKISDDRNYRLRTFSVLQANPAALSRSLNFHENT